jgi:hypothetical protein
MHLTKESTLVNSHDATVANTDLWTAYFQQGWSRWFAPFGLGAQSPVSGVAEGAAARVAGFLTLVAAGPIARMFSSNDLAPAAREGTAPALIQKDEIREETAA